MSLPWILVVVLGLTTLVLGWAFWSMKLELRTRWAEVGAIRPGPRFEEMIATLSLGHLSDGNDVRLLQNGDGFFPALLEEIARAKSSVHFETFLWKPGELSARLVDALCERARRGVAVRVLLDGIGGGISDAEKAALEQAGAQLRFYNRARLRNLGTFNTRDHRKLAVIDGCIGFLGGHCIGDDWLGNADHKKHFRDTSARIEGPIVTQLQGAFSENWTEAAGEILVGEELYPEQPAKGSVKAHLAYLNLARRSSSPKLLHHLAIESARREVVIQNPYFLPFSGARDALCRARKRGVRVRVMIPTREATDAKLVSHATAHALRPLLECGVEIFMYDRTLLHQKVFVIDGEWAGIGSTNFDDRSMDINEEITMSIFDRGVASELLDAFEADLAHARRMTLGEWQSRGFVEKAQGWLAWSVRAQL
ncbi:MAG: phospholipase D-like domain-containing protein [Myxococcota bacterium]|nr:phospholipase D-like domain-containing protein [Myxococcota bacterium]